MINASGPGQRRRHPPPSVERRRVERHRHLFEPTSSNFASVNSRSRRVASPSENGPGDAGRRHRLAELLAQHVEHEAQPRVAVAFGPNGDRSPDRRAAHARDLVDGALRVERRTASHHGSTRRRTPRRARRCLRCRGDGRARCRGRGCGRARPRCRPSRRRRRMRRPHRGRRAAPPRSSPHRDRMRARGRGRHDVGAVAATIHSVTFWPRVSTKLACWPQDSETADHIPCN